MDEAHIADAKIEAGLEWLRYTHPVSEHFAAQVRRTDLSGKRLAAWMHLLPDTILTVMPFVEAGVSVRVGACNPDSTDSRVVDYLARRGIEVFDGRREPRDLYDGTLRRFAAGPLDANCDMGRRAHRSRHPRGHVRRRSTGGDDDRIAPD